MASITSENRPPQTGEGLEKPDHYVEPSVEFVHCTKDAEKLIVQMARVSNPSNADNWATGPKLIRFLMKHEHWSPLEMATFCIKVRTTRDVSAQLTRHWSMRFQEFSQRYSKVDRPAIPELRRQGATNRQASTDDLPEELQDRFKNEIGDIFERTYVLYEEMLEQGVARETARRILPMCSRSDLYMHGNLRSWITFFKTRLTPDTQPECQEIARQARDIFVTMFPHVSEAAGI